MEEQVLKQVDIACRNHSNYVATITESLPLIPDISCLVSSYLMPSDVHYWLEERLLILNGNHFSGQRNIAKAIADLKGSNGILRAFEHKAKLCWARSQSDNYVMYLAWVVGCNRMECYKISRCFCDDPLLYSVLESRSRI